MKVSFRAEDMKRAMAICSKTIAAKDCGRELLTKVCFRFHWDGRAEAVGLDGYQMAICYFDYTLVEGETDDYEVMITPIRFPRSNVCTIEVKDSITTISFDDGTKYIQPQTFGKYIDIDKIQPNDSQKTFRIAFSPKMLANTLSAMKENEFVYLTFNGELGAVLIDGEHSRGLVLPKRITGQTENEMENRIAGRINNHE